MTVKDILKAHILRGNFILSSGQKSDYYIDVRSLVFNPQYFHYFAKELENKAKDIDFSSCGGIGLGSVGPTFALVSYGHMGFHIREAKKNYGTEKHLEGGPTGNKVLLLDDVMTTGRSLQNAQYFFKTQFPDVEIVEALVILDRSERSCLNFPVTSLVDIKEIL